MATTAARGTGPPARPCGCREGLPSQEGGRAVSTSTPRLLTVATVAERLQISEKTVRRWIDAGDLRSHRLGRCLRISEADLQEFVDQHRQ